MWLLLHSEDKMKHLQENKATWFHLRRQEGRYFCVLCSAVHRGRYWMARQRLSPSVTHLVALSGDPGSLWGQSAKVSRTAVVEGGVLVPRLHADAYKLSYWCLTAALQCIISTPYRPRNSLENSIRWQMVGPEFRVPLPDMLCHHALLLFNPEKKSNALYPATAPCQNAVRWK